MNDKNYTEQELIEALWLMRELWHAAMIELAALRGLRNLGDFHLLMTSEQKAKNAKVASVLTRAINPDVPRE